MPLYSNRLYEVAVFDQKGVAVVREHLAIGSEQRPDFLGYFDTVRGHSFTGEYIKEHENGISFQAEPQGWTLVFEEMTLERFNEFWREDVGLNIDFKNTEALWSWYSEAFESGYFH